MNLYRSPYRRSPYRRSPYRRSPYKGGMFSLTNPLEHHDKSSEYLQLENDRLEAKEEAERKLRELHIEPKKIYFVRGEQFKNFYNENLGERLSNDEADEYLTSTLMANNPPGMYFYTDIDIARTKMSNSQDILYEIPGYFEEGEILKNTNIRDAFLPDDYFEKFKEEFHAISITTRDSGNIILVLDPKRLGIPIEIEHYTQLPDVRDMSWRWGDDNPDIWL